MSVLRCDQLTIDRDGCPLLQGLSLSLGSGEILHLLGANGCGKSTLLQVLAGLHPPAAGQILFAGAPLARRDPQLLARQRLLLPQRQQIPFELEVADYLAIGWQACGFDGERWLDTPQFAACCRALDIDWLLGREIHHLSGGEWQRVRLAGCLMLAERSLNPESLLLLLDEPFTALDLRHKGDLLAAIRRLAAQGLAFVIVHHEPALAFAHAGRVALLGEGQLLACAPPVDALTPPLLARALGVAAQVARVEGDDVLITDIERKPRRL